MVRLLTLGMAGVLGGTVACGDREDCLGAQRIAEPGVELAALVENGANDGECVYDVWVTQGDAVYERLDCAPEDDACLCIGMLTTRIDDPHKDLEFLFLGLTPARNPFVVETVVRSPGETCSERYEATYAAPPIEQAFVPNCQAARKRMDECSVSPLSDSGCIDTSQHMEPDVACVYGCIAESSCADFDATLCVEEEPDTPTALVSCVAECLDLDTGDSEWLSAALALDCPS